MGTQVSCQSRIKKVKPASGKREQTISPQRNIINISKLIFKAKHAHLQKLSNLRQKRPPRALQHYLLGARIILTKSTLLTSTRRKVMQVLTE